MMDKIKQVLQSPLGKRKHVNPQHHMFGATLEDLVARNENLPTSAADDIPFLVDKICRYICAQGNQGIGHEGIFRVNGSARTVEKLKDSFEKYGDTDLDAADDIFSVAGLLKLFLRELQESVIPESMTTKFVHVQEAYRKDKAQCLDELKLLIDALPAAHHALLKYTIRFLVAVSSNTVNKMTPMGLAIVFGPNLFRCSAGIEGLKDQGVTNEIVCKFIQDYEKLFGSLDDPTAFTQPYVPQIKDSPKQKRNPPARPPPPRVTDVPPLSLGALPDGAEDFRPTPSPRLNSDEYMERASPFTIADTDGHSSIASPILSAVASELVTKTISEAVLEHIFNANEVRSIFDHWGGDSEAGSQKGTPTHSRLGTPQTGHDYIPNGVEDPGQHPRPRPLSAITTGSGDCHTSPQPQPRVTLATPEGDEDLQITTRPTPKPRTKSAPARQRAKQQALSQSADGTNRTSAPMVNGNQILKEEGLPHSASPNGFETLKSESPALTHFKKDKGPARKAPKRHRSESTNNSHGIVPVEEPEIIMHERMDTSEVNNNIKNSTDEKEANTSHDSSSSTIHEQTFSSDESSETVVPEEPDPETIVTDEPTVVPKLDLGKLSPPGETPSNVKQTDDETTPRADGEVTLQPDTDTTPRADNISGSSPPNNLSTDSPNPEQTKTITQEEEKRAADIKHISKKITAYKKKIRAFEEAFEAEHGRKPTKQERDAKIEIKKAVVELAKARKELKNLKESVADAQTEVARQASVELQAEQPNSRPASEREPVETKAETLEYSLRKLAEKRREANRPEDLELMTRDVIQEEKLAVQKALLHYEGIHGRPQTKSDKELMKPLYDRYRQIKKALVNAPTVLPPELAQKLNEQLQLPPEQPESDTANRNAASNMTKGAHEEEDCESPVERQTQTQPDLQDLPLQELIAELTRVNSEKKKLRKILREFEDDFHDRNGRKVERADRTPMANEYHEYKQIKAKIKLLEALISKQQES